MLCHIEIDIVALTNSSEPTGGRIENGIHRSEVGILELAATLVLHLVVRREGQPEHIEEVVEILFYAIGIGRAEGVVEDGREERRREHAVEGIALDVAYLDGCVESCLLSDFGREEPHGSGEYVAPDILQGFALDCGRDNFVGCLTRTVVDVLPADVLQHVAHVATELVANAGMHLAEVAIL